VPEEVEVKDGEDAEDAQSSSSLSPPRAPEPPSPAKSIAESEPRSIAESPARSIPGDSPRSVEDSADELEEIDTGPPKPLALSDSDPDEVAVESERVCGELAEARARIFHGHEA